MALTESAGLLFRLKADGSQARGELEDIQKRVGGAGSAFSSLAGPAAIATAGVAATADLERQTDEAFPKSIYTERWIVKTILPREFFEEVLAEMDDLRELTDLNESPKESILDDEFLILDSGEEHD